VDSGVRDTEEDKFESSPDLPKTLFIYAWGRVMDASTCARQLLEHLKRPEQQREARPAPAR
jgi:hypothetical protein